MNYFLLATAEESKPLITPDSVQVANIERIFTKVVNMDFSSLLETVLNQLLFIGLKIFVAFLVYWLGRFFIRRALTFAEALMTRKNVDRSLMNFVKSTASAILTGLLLLIIIGTLGVDVASVLAIFGGLSLAIGFALSNTAQNFAGGVMVLLLKPYRVGDYISSQGESGTVKEIKLFSTMIETVDRKTIYIPNNTISTAVINNYSEAKNRRVDWAVSIAYGDDVEVAREAILEILLKDKRILVGKDAPAEPVVYVLEMASSSVNLSVRAWVSNANYWDVFFEYNEVIYKTLPTKGINFPFPQLDVNIKK